MVFIFFYWAPIVKNTCTIEQQSHNKIIQYSRTMSGLSYYKRRFNLNEFNVQPVVALGVL
ncbi:hypothetical protein NQ315_014439 [Exocentrus adspersus]|uniref:Uncharacterized protein n=1 Tax=Exocentrus adspersus TaxID=1586481 RepID=A0AAV8V7F7_9CUCU|nr:hypothetical protein NQ315_014439 [Exocentrus adspersus]